LVRAKTHVGEPDFQGLMREALAVLTEPRSRSPQRPCSRGDERSESSNFTRYQAKLTPQEIEQRFPDEMGTAGVGVPASQH